MELRYFRPSPALRSMVNFLYVFKTIGGAFSDKLSALGPQVQIRLSDDFTYCWEQQKFVHGDRMMVTGPASQHVAISSLSPVTLIGCGLTPLGWAAMVGAPAFELTDDVIDGCAIWGTAGRQAIEQVGNAKGDAAQIAAFDHFLANRAQFRVVHPDPRIQIVERWVAEAPFARIDSLIDQLELSPRQTNRIVASAFGVPPKLLASKYRTLRAGFLLATGQASDWLDAGGEAFADQAHFIRNFKRFIGHTPGHYSEADARLARKVMHDKWRAGARTPLELWS